MARPSIYSEELATEICRRLAEGESLRSICRGDEMPNISTVLTWVLDGKHPEFSAQYALAREMQSEGYADEIIAISDGGGGEDDNVTVQRDKLRADSRKWIASRLLPKRYGDRVQQEVSGPGGGPIETKDTSDVARRLAFLLKQSEGGSSSESAE